MLLNQVDAARLLKYSEQDTARACDEPMNWVIRCRVMSSRPAALWRACGIKASHHSTSVLSTEVIDADMGRLDAGAVRSANSRFGAAESRESTLDWPSTPDSIEKIGATATAPPACQVFSDLDNFGCMSGLRCEAETTRQTYCARAATL